MVILWRHWPPTIRVRILTGFVWCIHHTCHIKWQDFYMFWDHISTVLTNIIAEFISTVLNIVEFISTVLLLSQNLFPWSLLSRNLLLRSLLSRNLFLRSLLSQNLFSRSLLSRNTNLFSWPELLTLNYWRRIIDTEVSKIHDEGRCGVMMWNKILVEYRLRSLLELV